MAAYTNSKIIYYNVCGSFILLLISENKNIINVNKIFCDKQTFTNQIFHASTIEIQLPTINALH